MASLRSHIEVNAPAERTWAIVRDPEALPKWFASIRQASVNSGVRVVELVRGGVVRERLVNVDDRLRRLQYAIEAGIAVESHVATVDVIELSPDSCLVVYSTEAKPDDVAQQIAGSVDAALAGLKAVAEGDLRDQ
jgi:uncharacterized protein YndB with AHSA1/START domain